MCFWILSRDIVERSLILEISVSGAEIALAGVGTLSCIPNGAGHGPCLAEWRAYLIKRQYNQGVRFGAGSLTVADALISHLGLPESMLLRAGLRPTDL